MRAWMIRRRFPLLIVLAAAALWPLALGCKLLSDRLTRWNMLDQQALEDPIKAVGGDAIVFAPKGDDPSAKAPPAGASAQELVAFYSPVFIQQRVNTAAQPHPYPPEYDQIGEARLRHEKGELKAFVAGPPVVYAIYQKLPIGGRDHVQLTYTAWYPAHPRMKAIDLEEADIDSCVLRVTLDDQNRPLFFETIAACGCFHKVFVERRIEEAASKVYGAPEKGKKFAVERTLKGSIDWEVAGVVDEARDGPRRPVVFVKAGDHKVIGLGSAGACACRRARTCILTRLRSTAISIPCPWRIRASTPLLRPRRRRQGAGGGAQGAVPHVLRRRRFRRAAAGQRPDQTSFRPEHLERHDHLRALPAPAAGNALTGPRRSVVADVSAEVVAARAVTKVFGSDAAKVEALRGVDLSAAAGEFVALMGASGSGKSTLLHLLAGLDRPTTGAVFVGGVDVAALNEAGRTRLRRRQVGIVFQDFNLIDVLTAEENVALPLAVAGRSAAESTRRARRILDEVGLMKRRTHRPDQLSGGEKQRVAVARALVVGPLVLLADEPTGNLDSVSAGQVLDLLRALADERRQTVVMATHDVVQARRADRLIVLRDGRVEARTAFPAGRPDDHGKERGLETLDLCLSGNARPAGPHPAHAPGNRPRDGGRLGDHADQPGGAPRLPRPV